MVVILVIFLTLIMLIETSTWQQKVVNVLDDQAREDAMNSIQIIAGPAAQLPAGAHHDRGTHGRHVRRVALDLRR